MFLGLICCLFGIDKLVLINIFLFNDENLFIRNSYYYSFVFVCVKRFLKNFLVKKLVGIKEVLL